MEETCELALQKRFIKASERWSSNMKDLQPLQPGSRVMLQNQHGAGKIAKRWDRTGIVLEDLGYNKYRIEIDGSGHVTDRNRQYLRQSTPVTASQPGPRNDYTNLTPRHVVDPKPVVEPEFQPFVEPEPVSQPQQQAIPEPQVPTTPPRQVAPLQLTSPTTPESPSFVTPPTTPVAITHTRGTKTV